VPDLLDDLRRYGDAVETAALDRDRPAYVADDEPEMLPAGRSPSRRMVLVGVAAVVLAAFVVSLTVLLRNDDHDSVRIDTPPTSITPDPPDGPIQPTVLPASNASWRELDAGPLRPRFGHATIWTGEDLIVWGGTIRDNLQDEKLSDGASYDVERGTWTLLPPSPLSARSEPVAAWTGQEALMWGDANGLDLDGAAYNPVTGVWRMIAPAPLPHGLEYSGAWTGTELVVLGARTTTPQAAAYDPESDRWRELDPPQIVLSEGAPRFEVVSTGERLVALGQFDQADPTQVLVYDPQTDEWSSRRPPEESARLLGAASIDGLVYTYGHSSNPNIGGLRSFDPVNDVWSPVVVVSDLGCAGGQEFAQTRSGIYATACGRAGLYEPDRYWMPIAPASPGPPSYLGETGEVGGRQLLWYGADHAALDQSGEQKMGLWTLTP
jgi:hypothetical protein